MTVKTYGIYGLTEWHGKVKAGTIEVALSFTGGTASSSGAQPAYMMTKDPITQFVIEHSKEYKERFITLVMRQELPGEHHRIAIPKEKDSGTAVKNTETKKAAEVPAEKEKKEAKERSLRSVEVASVEDAREWLVDNFEDIRKKDLMSKRAIKDMAASHGVVFAGIELE